ncbi:MAG TPA: hypothetical protein VN946_23470 [Terriglobales bacterium]|jgi:hypothetical protein|nr:hypothetical protein [Terriglobales bacterium]
MATKYVQIKNDLDIRQRLEADRTRLRKIAGLDQSPHIHRPVKHGLTSEERSKVTVLFRGFTWMHEDLIRAVLQGWGYRREKLPVPDMPAFQVDKQSTSPTLYASSGDFRRIFYEETDSLYRLSALLTADHEKAEWCFVAGLKDSVNGSTVFKQWARSWARRAIIQNAVRVINPLPMEKHAPLSFNSHGKTLAREQAEIAAVLELGPFERFVYVMSVLESYSDQDCSVLLGCARRDVLAARSRSLQRIEMQSTFTVSAR